jgi:hypothetical protein
MKGALGMGRLSLKRLTVEGLEGGLLYWVPWVMKGRLWGWVSLFMGGPTYGSSVKGTWMEGCLAGDPEGYVEKALETGISFHMGPAGESGRGLIYQGL